MEREIERILNDTYYLTFKVWQDGFRTYIITIKEIEKGIVYKFDYEGLTFEDNIKEIENIVSNEIVNYYRKVEK